MFKEIRIKDFFKSASTVLLSFILLSFIVDFIDKTSIFYKIDFLKLNRFLKIVMIVYSILFMCFHNSYVIKRTKYLIFVFLVISILFLFKYDFWHLYLDYFLRYTFFILLFPVIHYAFSTASSKPLKSYYSIFKFFVILNTVAIALGIFFDIHVFETYRGSRLGYNGIILSQGLTPYIYMTAAAVFWSYKDKKMLTLVLLLVIFSGVKGAYFGMFLFFNLLVLYNQKFTRVFKLRSLLALSGLLVLLIIGLFSLPTFKRVIQKDGFFSAIFSYRTDNFFEILSFRTPDNFSFLFGSKGLCPITVEMQVLDIFLFFGVVGIIAYLVFCIAMYRDVVRGAQAKAFFFSVIVLSTLSGNLFYNPIASTLFIVTLFYLEKGFTNNLRLIPKKQTALRQKKEV